MADKDPLALTEELFGFLQGQVPEGYKIGRRNIPHLRPEQAWTVIWYVANLYQRVPDFIGRCDVCGELYNSEREGDCLDYGRAPYYFCDTCMNTNGWYQKARRNPDKLLRPRT